MFGFSMETLQKITLMAAEASFLPPAEKSELITSLRHEIDQQSSGSDSGIGDQGLGEV